MNLWKEAHKTIANNARQDANRWQGDPIPNDGRPVWELVIEEMGARLVRLQEMRREHAVRKPGESAELLEAVDKEIAALAQLVADMKKRDALGAQKYGVPLQAHNGRDALVDAYQEALDLAVYLRQELQERGDSSGQLKDLRDAALAAEKRYDEVNRQLIVAREELKAARFELGTLRSQLAKQGDALAASREQAQKLFRQLGGA